MQFFYDPTTRVFTRTGKRLEDPRNKGEYLPAAFATPDPLPTLGEYETARRLADDSAWEVVADYRGTAWNTETKEPVAVYVVGPLTDGLTKIKPGPYDVWSGSEWVSDDEAELSDLRDDAANSVRSAFAQSSKLPVPANGTEWSGGMDSALAIDGAVRLAEQMGQTTIDLFDYENNAVAVDIETGRSIAAAVAADYQSKLAKKQQLLRDITSASADQLNTLVWVD